MFVSFAARFSLKHLVSSYSLEANMNVPVSDGDSTLVLLFFIVSPSRLLGGLPAEYISVDGTINNHCSVSP